MKICFLTNEYPPQVYGGAGVHVEYLSRELALLEEGRHDLGIFSFGDQKEKTANMAVEGVRPGFDFPFQNPRHQKLLDALFRNLLMTGSVREADIIHCHTWYTCLAGCLMQQLFSIPLVLTIHSLEPQRPWKEEQLGSAYRVSTWLEKTAYQNADGVIATSLPMMRAVHEFYQVPLGKIRIIPNGIDINQYRPSFDPDLLRSYRINPDRPFVLFVGRISRQKGIIHLVNAIQYLLPDIPVVLCAGAPDTPDIGLEMAEKVQEAQGKTRKEIVWIEKWVPKKHLIPLYSHAAVFACPSIYEPFGIVNLEAMACGTPVVASAIGGIPEVVVPEETGLLVPLEPKGENNLEPRDPQRFSQDFAEAVNRLFRSPEKREEMGRKSQERVRQHFTWQQVARQTLEFYKLLIARHSATPTRGR